MDLFLVELADVYDAEHRISRALPRIATAALSPGLSGATLVYLKQTEGHVFRCEQIFACLGKNVRRRICQTSVCMLEEMEELAEDFYLSPANDAAIIAALRKVVHHQIAFYECLLEWATLQQKPDASEILETILEEQQETYETLSELARCGSNEEALGESAWVSVDEGRDVAEQRSGTPSFLQAISLAVAGAAGNVNHKRVFVPRF